ncbi:hypothetical protein QUW13_07975 [Enterococcus hirae]|nr:hypothetical protein [Enterococcus hirae]
MIFTTMFETTLFLEEQKRAARAQTAGARILYEQARSLRLNKTYPQEVERQGKTFVITVDAAARPAISVKAEGIDYHVAPE